MKKLTCCITLPTVIVFPISLTSCKTNSDQTAEEVTITLKSNGGFLAQDKYIINKGTTYNSTLFNKPTKTNYVFKYWTTEDGNVIEDGYVFNDNTTLIAQYTYNPTPTPPVTETVTVSFDVDGGTSLSSKQIEKGKTFSEVSLPTPVKTDWLFEYWMVYLEDQWTQITSSYIFNADVTLKAKWKQSEKQKYISNLNIQPLLGTDGYLYEATFDEYSEAEGETYLKNLYSTPQEFTGGCCSSFLAGDFFGRNFEYHFGYHPEMIIHTTANENRHASVGVSYCYNLTKSELNTIDAYSKHRVLPFLTMDGVNDAGFACGINEVPSLDVGTNKGDNSANEKMHILRVVRYLLDHATSVANAQELLSNYNIYGTTRLNELHIMMADKTGACAELEFKKISFDTSNTAYYKEQNYVTAASTSNNFKNIVTNFSMIDYEGQCTDTWYESSKMANHSEGCERYNILYKNIVTDQIELDTYDKVLDLLSKVYYSNSYKYTPGSSDFWYSEFLYGSLTKSSTRDYSTFYSIWNGYQTAYNKFKNGQDARGYNLYVTLHSCAYNLQTQTFKLVFEETNRLTKEFAITR